MSLLRLSCFAFLLYASLLLTSLKKVAAAETPQTDTKAASYAPAQAIPVSCLNRTV